MKRVLPLFAFLLLFFCRQTHATLPAVVADALKQGCARSAPTADKVGRYIEAVKYLKGQLPRLAITPEERRSYLSACLTLSMNRNIMGSALQRRISTDLQKEIIDELELRSCMSPGVQAVTSAGAPGVCSQPAPQVLSELVTKEIRVVPPTKAELIEKIWSHVKKRLIDPRRLSPSLQSYRAAIVEYQHAEEALDLAKISSQDFYALYEESSPGKGKHAVAPEALDTTSSAHLQRDIETQWKQEMGKLSYKDLELKLQDEESGRQGRSGRLGH